MLLRSCLDSRRTRALVPALIDGADGVLMRLALLCRVVRIGWQRGDIGDLLECAARRRAIDPVAGQVRLGIAFPSQFHRVRRRGRPQAVRYSGWKLVFGRD